MYGFVKHLVAKQTFNRNGGEKLQGNVWLKELFEYNENGEALKDTSVKPWIWQEDELLEQYLFLMKQKSTLKKTFE